MNIGEGIIMHTLVEVDGIEYLNPISLLYKGIAAFQYHTAFRTSKLGQFTEVSEFVRVTVLFRALHHLLLIVLSYL